MGNIGSIELTKEEAFLKVNFAFTFGNENFYNIDIENKDGYFTTATPENLNDGIRFWLNK